MSQLDCFRRFFFEKPGIRGEWIRLDDSWLSTRTGIAYTSVLESQLGQALAAVVLLSGTIKFNGSLIPGPTVKAASRLWLPRLHITARFRGLAHWREPLSGSTMPELFGDSRMVLIILNENQQPYQGIITLAGEHLAAAIEAYFTHSEQLPTRL